MNIFLNTILILLYSIGIILVDIMCFSRLVFYYDWHFYENLMIWMCAAIVFVLHYALIWIMYKKGKPFVNCIIILQIIDYLLAGIYLTFIVILTVSPWTQMTLDAIYPPFVIHGVALILRRISRDKGTVILSPKKE